MLKGSAVLTALLLVSLQQAPLANDDFSPAPMVEAPHRAVAREEPVRRLRELAIGGGAVAFAGWAVSLIGWFGSIHCKTEWLVIVTGCTSTSPWLMLPLAGPWIAAASIGPSDGWFTASVALGGAQLAGLIAMIAGFVITVPEHDELSLSVAPTANGFALGGTF